MFGGWLFFVWGFVFFVCLFVRGLGVFSLSVYLVLLRAKIPEEYLSFPPLLNFSSGILRFIASGALY